MTSGDLFDCKKSVHEICNITSSLSVGEKFTLLFNHTVSPAIPPPSIMGVNGGLTILVSQVN